jgi:hypothetical protein
VALADFEKAANLDPKLKQAVELRDALKATFVPAKPQAP